MLARELLLAALDVAGLLRIGILLTRIAMVTAGPPVSLPSWLSRGVPALWTLARVPSRPRARAAGVAVVAIPATLQVMARRLRRVPQLPPAEPLHLGIGMLFPESRERRKQFFALSGPERRRQSARDDRPV
jgi:hypothetical protein